MRAVPAVVLLAFAVLGCSADPYPLLTPAGASQWTAAAVGEAVKSVVLYLQLRPGDRIELISATAPGLAAGADARFSFSPPVLFDNGGSSLGDRLEPLAGATYAVDPAATRGPASTVAVVAELTARSPGTYSLADVRLTFRLNGGHAETKDGISQTLTICAADPAPTSCEPSEAP